MSNSENVLRAEDVLEGCVLLAGVRHQSRESVLGAMVAALGQTMPSFPQDALLASILEREQVRSTGTPEGVAFPHGKHAMIDGVCAVIATAPHGIDFGGITPLPCSIIVLTVSSVYRADGHLHFLAHMARCLRYPEVRAAVLEAKSKSTLLDALHVAADATRVG